MTANPKPTVLVVDDEKPVRNLIRTILQGAGYPVLDARDGKEALKMISLPGSKIDILVADVIMPGMNGKNLANRICAILPEVRVLFISAYTADVLAYHNLYPDGVDFLRKPFRRAELIEKVTRIMAVSFTWKELVSKRRS